MSATLMEVPAGNPAGFTPTSLPPANSTRVPCSSSGVRVSSSSLEIDAIDGSASPRKPSVAIEGQQRVVVIHSDAVVDHADHLLAARFHLYANRSRPRVQRVFKQLLH